MSRCIHVYPFVARNHGGIPFSGVCPKGTPWSIRDTARYLLIYSVKRTQLIDRRPFSSCRVRKTAGYTLPRLLFSRTVPPFSEMYPDLAGSGTLPSTIFSARITFRSQPRTRKPKSSCSKQAMATGGPLLPKNTKTSTLPLLNIQCHFFTAWNGLWRQRERPKDTQTQVFLPGNRHCLFRRAIRSYQRTPIHQLSLLNIQCHLFTAWKGL